MAVPLSHTATYRIFGRTVQVRSRDTLGSHLLREELSLYPSGDPNVSADLEVIHAPPPTPGTYLANPRQHLEDEDGFTMLHPTVAVRFVLDGSRLRRIYFDERRAPTALRRGIRRLLDMQHTSREERAGVHIHESVLTPALYFDSERLLVHASALQDASNAVTLVGGTGGVGKTSIELELCQHHGYRFVADDVSVLDLDGHVHPNLAFPKIYAYNLEDNPGLTERVLNQRSPADRLHWHLHRRRGADKVRRRLSPEQLYGQYSQAGGPLGRYVLLVREARPSLTTEPLAPERAAAMSVSVIATEYYGFHNHLHWHAYNRQVQGRPPACKVDDVLDRWRRQLAALLRGVSCELVRIPVDLPHTTYKREMAALLT